MTFRNFFILLMVITLASTQYGMGRRSGQYDEEARAEMKQKNEHLKGDVNYSRQNPVKGIASGVHQATVESTSEFAGEVRDETKSGAPVVGTVEGARQGSEGLVDNAVKGAFKVATLGYGDVETLRKEQPEHGSGEPTKFKITL